MGRTVWTLCPIPFARALDVTVLLDSWKIALGFVVVSCTFRLLIWGTRQSHSPLEVQGQKGRVAVPGWQCPFSFRCRHSAHEEGALIHLTPPHAFWVPMALHTPLPFPSRCSACACRCSMDMGWQERCALLHISCAPCSKVSWTFPQETSIPSVTNPACQTASVWGFHVLRQKLFAYLILISCLHSRQWFCEHVYSLKYAYSYSCTLGSLYI